LRCAKARRDSSGLRNERIFAMKRTCALVAHSALPKSRLHFTSHPISELQRCGLALGVGPLGPTLRRRCNRALAPEETS
jgi:hypothetical protein